MITSQTQNGLFSVIAAELSAVEDCLREPVRDSGALLSTVASYALGSGGKRIRPALLLLAARACGADQWGRLVMLASVTEMMHVATLVHDDIVDHSTKRRGQPSAAALWGSDVSVLAGDFLFSRAIQILVADGDMRILQAFADATVSMITGEGLQLQLLRDDALDYTAREERLGKPVGNDFREGKITYPLIQLMRTASVADRAMVEDLARREQLGDEDLAGLRALVERYKGVAATMELVDQYLGQARVLLQVVPESPACHALYRLVDFVRHRDC
jgi:octaprenyl-diphosphate synthase